MRNHRLHNASLLDLLLPLFFINFNKIRRLLVKRICRVQATISLSSHNTHHIFPTHSRPRIPRNSNSSNNNSISWLRADNILNQVTLVLCINRTQVLDISQASNNSSNTCIILPLMGSRASHSKVFKAVLVEPLSALTIAEGVNLMGMPHFNSMRVVSIQGVSIFQLRVDTRQAQGFLMVTVSVDLSCNREVGQVSDCNSTMLVFETRLRFDDSGR